DVSAAQASARPIRSAHTIWELVLHVAAWDDAVLRRMGGNAVTLSDAENFPPVTDTGAAAWKETVEYVTREQYDLPKALAALPDSRLMDPVPGKKESYYNFLYMFAGIVQHEIYHAGQIAL